jgi:hypothetical protein
MSIHQLKERVISLGNEPFAVTGAVVVEEKLAKRNLDRGSRNAELVVRRHIAFAVSIVESDVVD